VSQSLAGRTAILTLLPFTLNELRGYQQDWDPFDLILMGFYPGLHDRKRKVERFFNSYLQTYVERDVRALLNVKDLVSFQQFLILLAGRIGQIVNYAALSNDVGVSTTTIKNWISLLKASHLIFELPPYFANLRKRVVRSPKFYFIDPGLAAFLLGLKSRDQIERDRLRGGLYENLIILELLKARYNAGVRPQIYFFRDSNGNEVDLIISEQGKLFPIEIKSATTFTKDFLKGIQRFQQCLPDKVAPGTVYYNGSQEFQVNGIHVTNFLGQHL